jgi:hypothetical protein
MLRVIEWFYFPSAFASQMTYACVPKYLEKPNFEIKVNLEAFKRPVGFNECLLRKIMRILGIARETESQEICRFLVFFDDMLECLIIAVETFQYSL